MLFVIYLITNVINQKKYVGQTQQGRERRRWLEHSVYCVNDNKILHNAIKKYGAENFEFKVLESEIPETLVDERESYYIKYYDTFYLTGNGYNMTAGGQGTHGYSHSEATKQRIKESNLTAWQRIKKAEPERYAQLCLNRSIANRGKPKSAAHKAKLSIAASKRTGARNSFFGKHFTEEAKEKLREAKAKSLTQINAYDLETGHLWKTFRFATEAVQELGLQESANSRIILVCKEQKGHAYGYIWRYKTDMDLCELPADVLIQEHKVPRAKPVLQYTLDDTFIAEFESAAEAARVLQPEEQKRRTYAKAISDACSGRKKTAYKFIWKYKV